MKKANRLKSLPIDLWQVPRLWPDGTVICIGGGTSLTIDDCYYACERVDGIIGINDAYRIYPAVHILYACDHKWWGWHYDKVKLEASLAKRVTGQRQAKVEYPDLHLLKIAHNPGWSDKPDTLHAGGHSGYQAINLAILTGASRIILLGYDMKPSGLRSHWFGNHPDNSRQNFTAWIDAFNGTDKLAKNIGVDIINCSRDTALKEFDLQPLESVL